MDHAQGIWHYIGAVRPDPNHQFTDIHGDFQTVSETALHREPTIRVKHLEGPDGILRLDDIRGHILEHERQSARVYK